jgi:fused signal recognition particle receptor
MLKKFFKKKAQPAEEPPEPTPAAAPSPEAAAPKADDKADSPAQEVPPQESTKADAVVPDGGLPDSPAESGNDDAKESRWSLFKGGLKKTREGLKSLFTFRLALDADSIDSIEEELYRADFGPEAVAELIDGSDGLRAAWKDKRITDFDGVRVYLRDLLKVMLTRREGALQRAEQGPTVILVSGVNGAGKTTSIAKLAKRLRDDGNSVILAAADTFRAAAVEQLTIWSERLGVEIITGKPEADPASVAFKGAEAALEKNADVLIVDTAGRLHTQRNLMRELRKIRDVLEKKIPGAPHEALLVLDATTGQNALNQARKFQEEIQVTGVVLAKLDGTAKGGIVVTINNQLDIPVKFIGLGEGIGDLEVFDVEHFVEALLEG